MKPERQYKQRRSISQGILVNDVHLRIPELPTSQLTQAGADKSLLGYLGREMVGTVHFAF